MKEFVVYETKKMYKYERYGLCYFILYKNRIYISNDDITGYLTLESPEDLEEIKKNTIYTESKTHSYYVNVNIFEKDISYIYIVPNIQVEIINGFKCIKKPYFGCLTKSIVDDLYNLAKKENPELKDDEGEIISSANMDKNHNNLYTLKIKQ